MTLKFKAIMLAMSVLFTTSTMASAVCTLPVYQIASRGEDLALPVSKAGAKSMRNDYLQELAKEFDDLAKVVGSDHPEEKAKKIGKIRRFFVMFRHFSELYTKQGKLPESAENLAFLPGKVVDALKNNNAAKAEDFLERLRDALSTKSRAKMLEDVSHLKIAKTKDIIKNVESSREGISKLLAKDKLDFEQYHDLKKGVRRLASILRYRVKLRGEEEYAQLADTYDDLLKMLGETTDEIAELKLEMPRKELERLDFTVTPEIRKRIEKFVKSVVLVYDF